MAGWKCVQHRHRHSNGREVKIDLKFNWHQVQGEENQSDMRSSIASGLRARQLHFELSFITQPWTMTLFWKSPKAQ